MLSTYEDGAFHGFPVYLKPGLDSDVHALFLIVPAYGSALVRADVGNKMLTTTGTSVWFAGHLVPAYACFKNE